MRGPGRSTGSINPKKKHLSLKDFISIFVRKHEAITAKICFVAADLGRLPPIGLDSLDVCTLLAQLQSTMAELEVVKANVTAQAVACSELQSTVTMQGGLCANLSDAVSALVATQSEVTAQPVLSSVLEQTPILPAACPVQPVTVALPPKDGISYARAASTTSANDGKTSTEPEWQTVASKRPKPQVKGNRNNKCNQRLKSII